MTVVMVPGNAHRCENCYAVVMDSDKKAHADMHKRQGEATMRRARQLRAAAGAK